MGRGFVYILTLGFVAGFAFLTVRVLLDDGLTIVGGAALAAILVTAGAPFAYAGFPLLLLAGPGTPEWRTTSPRVLAIGLALVALSWWRARP